MTGNSRREGFHFERELPVLFCICYSVDLMVHPGFVLSFSFCLFSVVLSLKSFCGLYLLVSLVMGMCSSTSAISLHSAQMPFELTRSFSEANTLDFLHELQIYSLGPPSALTISLGVGGGGVASMPCLHLRQTA